MIGIHTDITQRKLLEVELERQAHLDYLTGISNRRYFMDQAEFELNRARRYSTPLSLFMLDIDFFKQINDTRGHAAGDVVLKKLAEVCQQTLREVDIFGRIGGEEFAILLPGADINAAAEVAERLRAQLASTVVQFESGQPVHFTVSIGVTTLTHPNDNIDMLLSMADKALYDAKNNGRNRVCVAAG